MPASWTWWGRKRHRIGAARDLERQLSRRRERRRVRRRHLRAQLDAIGADDLEQRRAFVVRRRRASPTPRRSGRRSGARRTNALPAAAPPPLRSVSSRCASARLRGAQPRFSDRRRRAARLRRAAPAPRARPAAARRASAPRARLRAPPAPRRPPPRASRDRRRSASRGSSRPSACPARTRRADRIRRVGVNRPAAGAATTASPPVSGSIAAGTRMAVRSSTSRTGVGRERVGPLLLLQIGDRGGIVRPARFPASAIAAFSSANTVTMPRS